MTAAGDALKCPLSRQQAIDAYFMEHRAKLIDVAAFLDRVERCDGDADDFRMRAFRDALALLSDGRPQRAKRVLEIFSDMTTDPIAEAGEKGASGAWPERPGGTGSAT